MVNATKEIRSDKIYQQDIFHGELGPCFDTFLKRPDNYYNTTISQITNNNSEYTTESIIDPNQLITHTHKNKISHDNFRDSEFFLPLVDEMGNHIKNNPHIHYYDAIVTLDDKEKIKLQSLTESKNQHNPANIIQKIAYKINALTKLGLLFGLPFVIYNRKKLQFSMTKSIQYFKISNKIKKLFIFK